MIRTLTIVFLFLFFSASAQQKKWSTEIANTVVRQWKDSISPERMPDTWSYEMGVILKGFENCWLNSGDPMYFNYILQQMDLFVKDDGYINTYKREEFDIDNINNGKSILTLFRVTQKEKYLKTARLLMDQLQKQPRTAEGSFWYKKVYSGQVWLEGLYMAQPFYAEFALLSGEDSNLNDIARQFVLIEKHTRDTKTGLLYHAWDETKEQAWANKQTGCSPLFFARAMGWYVNALVDVLDYYPQYHPGRKELIGILNRLVNAISKEQDTTTGLWKDILHYYGPGKEKNYFEASASSLFVYAIAKGVRKGYLPSSKIIIAKKGYDGIIKKFIKIESGITHLDGTVKNSGLGGKPGKYGSFESYISEPVRRDDAKGIGAFLLAATEMELLPTLSFAKGKQVVLDNYFNRETKADVFGKRIVFHYKWWEKDNGGYFFLHHIINKYGAITSVLDEAPTTKNLARVSVYFLVDPDWPKENKTPNYIEPAHSEAIYQYVKNGGTLVMMANDSNNVEFMRFNELAKRFGIHWNENVRHDVINNQFEQAALLIPARHPIFKKAKKVFIKQLCTQTITLPAFSVYSEKGEVLMSISHVGKGWVFAVGDPWFYNEYVDGRIIPQEYQNYQAAEDLVKWLLGTKNAKN